MKNAFVIAAAFALAGCQTVNSALDTIGAGGGTQAEVQGSAPPPPAESQLAMVAPSRQPGSGALAGQSADAMLSLWGEPSLKRKDLGAELWQYTSKSCTLLVYLYPNAAGAMTVSHAEAVPGGTDEAALTACAKAAGRPSPKPIS